MFHELFLDAGVVSHPVYYIKRKHIAFCAVLHRSVLSPANIRLILRGLLRRPICFLPQLLRLLQLFDGRSVLLHSRIVHLYTVSLEDALYLVDELPHSLEELLAHRADRPVLGLGNMVHKVIQRLLVGQDLLGEVGGDLVHCLLRGQIDLPAACFKVYALLPLHCGIFPVDASSGLAHHLHRVVPELCVLPGRKALHTVGQLMLHHDHDRVRGIRRDMDGAGASLPSRGGTGESFTFPQERGKMWASLLARGQVGTS